MEAMQSVIPGGQCHTYADYVHNNEFLPGDYELWLSKPNHMVYF
jgi:hypothetical protein